MKKALKLTSFEQPTDYKLFDFIFKIGLSSSGRTLSLMAFEMFILKN